MGNKEAATAFKELLDLSDRLLGPGGCPWDHEQTLVSMRESILEEACEVIEAIDEGKDSDLMEELGDLLYNIIFFGKLAEKEGRFTVEDPVRMIGEKLIARHPHVFGENKVHDADSALKQWEEIKKTEKKERESLMDGLPKGLPALARSYKMAKKMVKSGVKNEAPGSLFDTEEELGKLLWQIVFEASRKKINPEMALRKEMVDKENEFRKREKKA